MISRLLKKHPTTAPSAQAARTRSGAGHASWAGLLVVAGAWQVLPACADEPVETYVTAQASTLDADSGLEPRRLIVAAEPITAATGRPARLQWRAVRRPASVSPGEDHTRLIAHEQIVSDTPSAAPQLISASESRGPMRIAQLDALNDDPFDDPFGDNGLNQPGEPRPIEELESDLPEREPLTPGEPESLEPPFEDPGFEPEPMPEQPTAPVRPPIEPRPLTEEGSQRDSLEAECSKAFQDLRQKKLADIDLTIDFDGIEGRDYPQACDLDEGEFVGRHWCHTQFAWTASGLCHKPLYFEQINVERYGHSLGPIGQPVLSAAHFFLSVPLVPYKMGVHPPNECIYALGDYRPGDCAPYFIPPIPISARGALFQAGAIVGVAAALP